MSCQIRLYQEFILINVNYKEILHASVPRRPFLQFYHTDMTTFYNFLLYKFQKYEKKSMKVFAITINISLTFKPIALIVSISM